MYVVYNAVADGFLPQHHHHMQLSPLSLRIITLMEPARYIPSRVSQPGLSEHRGTWSTCSGGCDTHPLHNLGQTHSHGHPQRSRTGREQDVLPRQDAPVRL